jgi:hypothetical protein
MDIPTKPSCLYCCNRLREGSGLKCEAFPEGIPEAVYDSWYKVGRYKPCPEFEFEGVSTKYDLARGFGIGILYLVALLYIICERELRLPHALIALLVAFIAYEGSLHTMRNERNYWIVSFRNCRMLLEEEKAKKQ